MLARVGTIYRARVSHTTATCPKRAKTDVSSLKTVHARASKLETSETEDWLIIQKKMNKLHRKMISLKREVESLKQKEKAHLKVGQSSPSTTSTTTNALEDDSMPLSRQLALVQQLQNRLKTLQNKWSNFILGEKASGEPENNFGQFETAYENAYWTRKPILVGLEKALTLHPEIAHITLHHLRVASDVLSFADSISSEHELDVDEAIEALRLLRASHAPPPSSTVRCGDFETPLRELLAAEPEKPRRRWLKLKLNAMMKMKMMTIAITTKMMMMMTITTITMKMTTMMIKKASTNER